MDKKPVYILGISAFYHDSAACLIRDGEIVAAAQEERFTRKRHDPAFPACACRYCLREAGISSSDLSFVVFYDKPFLKFERLLATYLQFAPAGFRSFMHAIPVWLKDKLWVRNTIARELGYKKDRIIFCGHHESHAASAFFPSPFRDAAFLTLDGVGEWATASFGSVNGNTVSIDSEIDFPHSLGLLYSAFTQYLGFKVNSGEYKVMGLAPYGEPVYRDRILAELVDLKDDGSFRLNLAYFDYCRGLTMVNRRFERLFGGPVRAPGSSLDQRHMDVARSIQAVTEEIILRMARHVAKVTGMKNLCLAGGVALNCVANGRILREGIFDNVWIQPAAGDSGGALGAALSCWYRYLGNERTAGGTVDFQKGSLLGPAFSDGQIRSFLDEGSIRYSRLSDDEIPGRVAELIGDQKVVGWFQGRMEFGPRALGNRSILGDARSGQMRDIVNRKIKFRESFRPFAASVLKERAREYFDLGAESPYMLFTCPVREDKRAVIPAVTHVDFSSRVQTVDEERNPLFYRLIKRFGERYGCPVVINTSFNVRGEPIVCTPADAFRCFTRTDMDYLMLGNYLIGKDGQDAVCGIPPGKSRSIIATACRFPARVAGAAAWLSFALFFFTGFTAIGFLARRCGPKLIERGFRGGGKTYWIPVPRVAFDKSRYEKQF